MSIDPNNPVAQSGLVEVANAFGEPDLGLGAAATSYRLYPSDSAPRSIGNLVLRVSDPANARSTLEQLTSVKDSATLRLALAREGWERSSGSEAADIGTMSERRPILVTALAAVQPPTGLRVYAKEVSQRLSRLDDRVWVATWSEGLEDLPRTIRVARGRGVASVTSFLSRWSWLQGQLDGAARHLDAAVVLHLLPEVGRTRRPQVIVLHDLTPEFAQTTWRQRLYYRTVVRASARQADHVVVDSEQTRTDAIRKYGLDPARMTVVHAGVDLDVYRPTSSTRAARPYVISVGSHAPHKQLGLLLRAYQGCAVRRTHDLVLVGPFHRRYTPPLISLTRQLGLDEEVRFRYGVSMRELVGLYGGADVLVSLSSREGFGLPTLEALACGTAVVSTDTGAARECIGEAGIILPSDPDEDVICAALAKAVGSLTDPVVRMRARSRAEHYSWQNTAERLLGIVDRFFRV